MSDEPPTARATAWIVTVGEYSDCATLSVSFTKAEAQQYADAYNAEREDGHGSEATVEEIDLFEAGDPLPRRITLWNGDERDAWPVTYMTTRPEDFIPLVHTATGGPNRAVFVQHFPTKEAAQAAANEALSNDLCSSCGVGQPFHRTSCGRPS